VFSGQGHCEIQGLAIELFSHLKKQKETNLQIILNADGEHPTFDQESSDSKTIFP
jgi:hypothetical protein